MSKQPEHILVIRLSAMGDVAMTVPVLRAFSKQYPKVQLTILTKAFFKPFFRDIPNANVFEAQIEHEHKGLIGLWKLSKQLKQLNFDAVADLHNVLRSKILKFFFFGKKVVQIDKGRSEKKALIKGLVFEQLKSTHDRYAEVFGQLGYPIDMSQPEFPKKASLKPKYLNVIGTDTQHWIGVAPCAAHSGKMYPLHLMAKVVETLSQRHKVVLFGAGKKEAKLLEALARHKYNVVSVAGRFSLEEELDIMSNLDVMISMDSGNGHMAAMLGVKVISVWGVTHPYAGFLPFNHTIDSAVLADKATYPKIPTSIYGNKIPKGYQTVMESISPEQITKKVSECLERKSLIQEE